MRIKSVIWLFSALFLTLPAIGQVCGTDYYLEQEYAKDPSFRNVVEQNWIVSDAPAVQAEGARAVKIVPVVFHIFHDNGIGNLSYEQIESAITMINEDFRRTNSDASDTRSIFLPYAADSEIEFRLAKIDPNGDCTNGVVRINDAGIANDGGNNTKSASYWQSNKYFNIWVVNSIAGGGGGGIILGYAQFPGSGSWSTYGVVIRGDRVGSTGTAGTGDRTLTHEIGHCFNLLHTFQSGCGSNCSNSGDRVCDTPPVSYSTQSCNFSQNQCSNDAIGNSPYTTDVKDQIENYMSYNDCQNLFTLNQKSRMQSSLSNFLTLKQLTSTSNLNATGALLGNAGVCEAVFEVDRQVVCVGDIIDFQDQSYFSPETFSWEFQGGSPNVSTAQHPSIQYNQPGVYEVKLTIYDSANNSASITKTNFITVISSDGNTSPLIESFENTGDLASLGWFPAANISGNEWEKSTTSGSTGTNAMKAVAFNYTGKVIVDGPALDVSNMNNATVSFKYAYAPRIGGGNNYLRGYISTDCGETWKLRFVTGGASIATAPEMYGPYTTPASSEWKDKTFTLSSGDVIDNLRLRFELTSSEGNNFFIDDINIEGDLSSTVVLKSPENGATGLSAATLLNWNATSPANVYKIEIDTTPNFNSPLLQQFQNQYLTVNSQDIDTEYLTSGLSNGVIYYWRVQSEKIGFPSTWSDTWNFSVNVNGIGKEIAKSKDLSINVYPNPANELVNIDLEVLNSGNVEISLYDVTGNLIQTVYNGYLTNGSSNFQIQRNGLSSGIYLIQTTTESSIQTTRVILQ